jgi:ribosomal protein L11 methyltransferase
VDELVRVVVEVPGTDVDEASGLAWSSSGAGSSAVAGIEEQPDPDGGDGVRLLVSLPAGSVDDLLAVLGGRWPATVAGPVSSEPWLDAWRDWARPVRVGRLVLQPPWLGPLPGGPGASGEAGDLVLRLDPGRAFGSGAHPTTRLVLAELQAAGVDGASVLDVGCGSGVLAVAAALLGATAVTGVDLDPAAHAATRANAEANGVAGQVEVAPGDLAELEGRFDVVVANIGAGVLEELAPLVVARVAPGGLVVLSGVLVEQAPQVVAAYGAVGAAVSSTDAGWVAITGRAP